MLFSMLILLLSIRKLLLLKECLKQLRKKKKSVKLLLKLLRVRNPLIKQLKSISVTLRNLSSLTLQSLINSSMQKMIAMQSLRNYMRKSGLQRKQRILQELLSLKQMLKLQKLTEGQLVSSQKKKWISMHTSIVQQRFILMLKSL